MLIKLQSLQSSYQSELKNGVGSNKLVLSLMNINAIFTDWRRIMENKRVYLTKWLVSRLLIDWPPSYVHYHPIIPCSITSINIFLYELPLFLGSEHRTGEKRNGCLRNLADTSLSSPV